MRTEKSQHLANPEQYKKKLLLWAQSSECLAWLDSNSHGNRYSRFEAVLAMGKQSEIVVDYDCFERLTEYIENTKDWIFGYFSYDLKNELETLRSKNFDGLCFPALHFFHPKKLFFIKGETLLISYLDDCKDEIEGDLRSILNSKPSSSEKSQCEPVKIKMRIFKDDYFSRVEEMLSHIQRGDIYEANFCQEFYADNCELDPICTFLRLNEISKAPFSAFLKLGENFVLCASPERYLQRNNDRVISQPIKGTARRSDDPEIDETLKHLLQHDEKERSENIMIVDMVRNDLAQTAVKGSVKVEELCKIYSYDQVHQMTSTVSSKVAKQTSSIDIIQHSFPMGSMTGAPKISAMKLIEDLEETKRGVYSGAIGYFDPSTNFDFNVVIRSILYNSKRKYISYSVGSAITAKSDPAKEYEECLIKAKAMREVLEGK